jgi:hypothetical protein
LYSCQKGGGYNITLQHQNAPWQVEQLRLTSFVRQSLIDYDQWWKTLNNGNAPQNELRQNVGSSGSVYQADGLFGSGSLALVTRGDRYDWILNPAQTAASNSPIPVIGLLNEVTSGFTGTFANWLTTAPVCGRLALGMIVVLPVSSKVEGYEKLKALLNGKVTLDPQKSQDFLYRINRPRPSKAHSNISINRLSEWVVLNFNLVNFALNGIGYQSGNVSTSASEFAVRISLDLSSGAEFTGDLDSTQQKALFEEFIESALEIITFGDVE